MAKNIEINIQTSTGYEALYPKIDLTNNQGSALPLSSTSGNLASSRLSAGTLSGAFTFGSVVSGVTPTSTSHLATKGYVDGLLSSSGGDCAVEYVNYTGTGSNSKTVTYPAHSGMRIYIVFIVLSDYIRDGDSSDDYYLMISPLMFSAVGSTAPYMGVGSDRSSKVSTNTYTSGGPVLNSANVVKYQGKFIFNSYAFNSSSVTYYTTAIFGPN